MYIRKATINDIPHITRLLSVLFEQEAEFSPDTEKQRAGIETILANPEIGCFFVLEDENRTVLGTISLLYSVSTALGGKVATIEDMFVDERARGKGFGSQLLAHAVQYAFSNDCLRLTVLTDRDNLNAQTLYKKYGFISSPMIPLRLFK